MDDPLVPPFDTKIAIVVRGDLPTWQRLNVTAFLASGIAAECPHLVGRPYADADGTAYLALLGMPVLIFEGSGSVLTTARERALRRGLPLAVFTSQMFATGHDAANRGAVEAVPGDELDLVGVALHGPRNGVDKVVKGVSLHP
ncbi:MAG TPA: DUF2000 domain-containing protein [Ornithinimicrobium sp.]|uniref:DUF2000 domain-containing protein n=1 Tax=Ornithinimicrobium sp. TaxID=1977084 RepID=UPI002B4858CB|nr:DUF2000 domain-containing protein [Ornithinimicrobium sp.]HKJ12734.1 DUF2000 domain-containing protein [Ornithinimicrobium sp.]